MRCNYVSNVNFGKAIPTKDKAEYAAVLAEAKKALKIDDGLSLIKMNAAGMPSSDEQDTGVGKLNSKEAADCINYLSFYTGANAFKTFPSGQITKNWDGFYCPYLKTSITTGEEHINLFSLSSKKYGNILDKQDAYEFVISNKTDKKDRVNYENEIGRSEDYPILKPLKKAYDNFKMGKSTPELEKEFEKFKNDPFVERNYTRLALYPFLAEVEPDLFEDFDKSPEKQEKFEQYKKEYKDEIDFFKFRQFITQKEFKEGKDRINANGQKLFGDCLIGFSKQEIWANPDAFMPNTSIGLYTWGLPALKFDEILDPNSAAYQVFNDKISYFLKQFDGIRFDVGWCYAIARTENDDHVEKQFDMKHNLFDFIEKRAHEIKGDDFNTQNLIYEMDGFEHLFDWSQNPPVPLENIRNIVNVLTTEYEHTDGAGWGNPEFLQKTGLTQDEFIIGTNNHDGSNLRRLAESQEEADIEKREKSAVALSRALNIPVEKILSNSKEFVKAKFAELFTTKNQFLYVNDVLGSDVDDDDQTVNTENYRYRITNDYERTYHTALQKGDGFNAPEALKTVMKSKNLDKTNKELYDKISYWAKYLRAPGAKTEQEANEQALNFVG